MTEASLSRALVELDGAIEPAPVKAALVAISTLFEWGAAMGLPVPANIASASKFWRDDLADLPADLLERAVSTIRKTWKWGGKMPLPSDLRECVAKPLQDRLAQRARHQNALRRLRRDAKERAEREARYASRKPLDLPPLRGNRMDRSRDDGSKTVDLGDTATRLREWEQKAGV